MTALLRQIGVVGNAEGKEGPNDAREIEKEIKIEYKRTSTA